MASEATSKSEKAEDPVFGEGLLPLRWDVLTVSSQGRKGQKGFLVVLLYGGSLSPCPDPITLGVRFHRTSFGKQSALAK